MIQLRRLLAVDVRQWRCLTIRHQQCVVQAFLVFRDISQKNVPLLSFRFSIPFTSVSSRNSLSEKNHNQITLYCVFLCFPRICFSKVIVVKYITTSFRVYYVISSVFQEFVFQWPSPSNVRHCLFPLCFLSARLCRINLSEITNMTSLIEGNKPMCSFS
jgi:hypothetical protein